MKMNNNFEFLDKDGNILSYPDGVKALLKLKGWTYQDLADATGYSKRTAEGWGQDRVPPKPALIIFSYLL